MAKLRLMMLVDSLKAGGTEKQVLLLGEGLSRRGWEVRVVVLDGETPLADGPAARPFEVRRLEGPGLLAALRREVAGFRPHLLHSFSARPHAYCLALKALGCAPRWVVGVRDSNPLFAIRRPASLASDLLAFLARFGVAAFVANSAAALRAKGLAPGPTAHVLPNLLDPRFRPRPLRERLEARRSLGLPQDAFVVGTVCNTTPYKGLEVLIEAFAAAGIGHLALVGEERGRYGERLLNAARARLGGRFTYLGLRGDVPDVMPAFDLYCSSSLSEGSSNSIGEAMASGLPCAVTDAGDGAALVGDTGWVVPKGDAPALCRAILEAAGAGTAALAERGARAAERIAALREPGKALAAHDELLRALADPGPPAAPPRPHGARRFLVLAAGLTLLMALSTWRGTWVGDFWEHVGTVRELRQNLRFPSHPQVISEAPSPYFSPYSLMVGGLSCLTGLSPIASLSIAGIANLILLLWGVWGFARSAAEDDAPCLAPAYFLAFLLVLWGSSPWNWSSVFHLNSLGNILPYPSTFAAALTLLLCANARQSFLSSSLWPIARLTGGMTLVCLVHPSTVIPLYVFTFTAALSAARIPKFIAAACASLLLALAWPYYPFSDLLFGTPNMVIHAANIGIYQETLARTWPAFLVGVPLMVSRLRDRPDDPLALSALMLAGIYFFGFVTGQYTYGRSVSYLVMVFQLLAAVWAARLEVAAKGGDKSARLLLSALLGLAGVSAIGFLPAVHAPLFGWRASYRESEFLKKLPGVVGDRDVVLANLEFGNMLPGFAGRVVSRRWPLIWVLDDNRRKADLGGFFSVGAGCRDRLEVAQRYGARFVALQLTGDTADAAAEEISKLPWLSVVLEDGQYRLLAVGTKASCPD